MINARRACHYLFVTLVGFPFGRLFAADLPASEPSSSRLPAASPPSLRVVTPGAPTPTSPDALADPARLRTMMDEHFDFVWRQLRRFGLSEDTADDAAQRVFLVAAQRLGTIELGRERAFLFGTAMRAAMEARRSIARRRESHEPPEDDQLHDPRPLADELIDRARARAQLDDVLESMEVDVRVVFVLFEIEEMSTGEIAAMLEVPAGTVASRLRRGREQFEAIVKRRRAIAARGGVR